MNPYKNHFGMIMLSMVAICISLIMATSAIFVDKLTFTVPPLVKNWGAALLVISLTGMILPLTDWFFALGRKMGLKPEILPHVLLENFVATLFFNTTATLVLTAVNISNNSGIKAAVVAGFIPSVSTVYTQSVTYDWPIMFIISYIFAPFVTKVAIKIARSSMGELRSPHSPQNVSA